MRSNRSKFIYLGDFTLFIAVIQDRANQVSAFISLTRPGDGYGFVLHSARWDFFFAAINLSLPYLRALHSSGGVICHDSPIGVQAAAATIH